MRKETKNRPSNVLIFDELDSLKSLPCLDIKGSSTAFLVIALGGSEYDGRFRYLRDVTDKNANEKHLVVDGTAKDGPAPDVEVHEVYDEEKLGSLSITVDRAIGEISSDVTYIYFDSVTELLKREELKGVYRFLNALTGRIRVQDSVGYFSISPEIDDERVVGTLGELFDRRVGKE